ncbi:MAG: DUF2071 domain-containing protein [Verrucomicrobiota bacterium]
MKTTLPVVTGIIARRILVNFRAIPEAIAGLLPAPFRPKLVHGHAIVGICLIRLEQLRPKGLPAAIGISTENAAHRIAVEWAEGGATREGVFVARRETNTTAIALTGGRLFPGEHHQAQFEITDNGAKVELKITTEDRLADVHVVAHIADTVMPGSIFKTLAEASQFFCAGSMGYSPNHRTREIEVMELRTLKWEMQPLLVEQAYSAWFSDKARFPEGAPELDSAFFMRGIEHEWHAGANLREAK